MLNYSDYYTYLLFVVLKGHLFTLKYLNVNALILEGVVWKFILQHKFRTYQMHLIKNIVIKCLLLVSLHGYMH